MKLERWKGYLECVVDRKEKEDIKVDSFYIKTKDGRRLPEFEPGQFIAVRVRHEDGTYSKIRQYTLSEMYNGEYYRISVKREDEGNVSKILCDEIHEGDEIEISAPVGKFVLIENQKPVVFIGGGIGITPMLTMANAALDSNRNIYLIYSLQNSDYHSFREEINELNSYEHVTAKTFYTRPKESDQITKDYDYKGRIGYEWMEENLPKDADFYFCGPVPFMRTIYHSLVKMGIQQDSIHYELFVAGVDITKPEEE